MNSKDNLTKNRKKIKKKQKTSTESIDKESQHQNIIIDDSLEYIAPRKNIHSCLESKIDTLLEIIKKTMLSAKKYKVMYIGDGGNGSYLANGIHYGSAWADDPSGARASVILNSYARAGFNVLILCFWNYYVVGGVCGAPYDCNWVSDWISAGKYGAQQKIIDDLHTNYQDIKILVSGGGANGNVGPGINKPGGTEWGEALAKFAIDNYLDGVDLDLEGGMMGTWWDIDTYNWIQDAIVAIQTAFKSTDKIISFAPVAPLCANPIVDDGKKYSCDKTTWMCNEDSASTQSQTDCEASCKAPTTMYSCDKMTWMCNEDSAGTQTQAECEAVCTPSVCGSQPSHETCNCTGEAYFGPKFVGGTDPGSGVELTFDQLKDGPHLTKTTTGSIQCTVAAFGGSDPAPGRYKQCFCAP